MGGITAQQATDLLPAVLNGLLVAVVAVIAFFLKDTVKAIHENTHELTQVRLVVVKLKVRVDMMERLWGRGRLDDLHGEERG